MELAGKTLLEACRVYRASGGLRASSRVSWASEGSWHSGMGVHSILVY